MGAFLEIEKFEEVGKSAKHGAVESFHQSPAVALAQQNAVGGRLHGGWVSFPPNAEHDIVEGHASEPHQSVAEDE